jgi:DNA-binding MarR family transcriptional regulator
MTQTVAPESINHLLAQVSRLHHSRAHTLLEEIGLYRGQHHVLRLLWEEEGRTHSELAEGLYVRPATVSKMIQRMKKAGFVQCRHDPEDQRISRVYLTEAGRAIREEVQRVWRTLEEETFAGLTPEEQGMLHQFLLQLYNNLLQAHGQTYGEAPSS